MGIESDAVYIIKKNIGYAKFFLKVGKRSDAEDRLTKALLIIEKESQSMFTTTDLTHKFMEFTKEIDALWKEAKETSDPPGSSFVLAMGDMVYLATPGGGMSVVHLEPEDDSTSSTGSTGSSAKPPIPPNPTNNSSGSSQKKKAPKGFFGRFNLFGGGGNNDEIDDDIDDEDGNDNMKELEQLMREQEQATQNAKDRLKKMQEKEKREKEEEGLKQQSEETLRQNAERIGTERRDKEKALENSKNSVNLEDRDISYILEKPRAEINSSKDMNDHVAYTVAHIGKNNLARRSTFLEAMDGKAKSDTDVSGRNKSLVNSSGNINTRLYSKTYFNPICDAINGTGVGNYEEEFIRYVNGEEDNSSKPSVKGVADVTRFDIMVLQTVPPRVSKRRGGSAEIDPTGLKKISSFAFLDINRFNPSELYISLICANKDKPIVTIFPEETVKNGKLLMDKIMDVARVYGKSRVVLGSVKSAIGIYFSRGFQTTSKEFNDIFSHYNFTTKSILTGAYERVTESNEDRGLINKAFNDYRQPLEELEDTHAKSAKEGNVELTNYINDSVYKGRSLQIAKYIAVEIFEVMRQRRHLVRVIMETGKRLNLSGTSTILARMLKDLSFSLLDIYVLDKHGESEISMFKDI